MANLFSAQFSVPIPKRSVRGGAHKSQKTAKVLSTRPRLHSQNCTSFDKKDALDIADAHTCHLTVTHEYAHTQHRQTPEPVCFRISSLARTCAPVRTSLRPHSVQSPRVVCPHDVVNHKAAVPAGADVHY